MTLIKERPERNKMEAIVFGLIKQADVIEAAAYDESISDAAKGVLMVAAETVRSLAISANVQCESVVFEMMQMKAKDKDKEDK